VTSTRRVAAKLMPASGDGAQLEQRERTRARHDLVDDAVLRLG
jgi:hypothetical protein